MEYKFSLDENDYLTYQLFVASTSQPSINRRRKDWAITTSVFFLLAFLFQYYSNVLPSTLFMIIGVVNLIFFPFYSRWRYKKHYRKHIKEHHSQSFGQESLVNFDNKFISIIEADSSEARINYQQVAAIHELPDHFLIRLINGHTLILPKSKVPDPDQLRLDISKMANKIDLEIVDNRSWKWK